MKQAPIIFSTDMVLALVAGRKTVTRREATPSYNEGDLLYVRENWRPMGYVLNASEEFDVDSEYYIQYMADGSFSRGYLEADQDRKYCAMIEKEIDTRKITLNGDGSFPKDFLFNPRPSIHMLKGFARIWLQCTDISCVYLHKISNSDAIQEGIEYINASIGATSFPPFHFRDYLNKGEKFFSAYDSFKSLWCKINGVDSWDANPSLWRIQFRVVSTTGFENIKL